MRAYSNATKGTPAVNVCNPSDAACADLSTNAVTGDLVITTIGGLDCSVVVCTIKTWYSQPSGTACGGANCNVTQTTIASRAVLVPSGCPGLAGNRPCAAFAEGSCYVAANSITQAQPVSISNVSRATTIATYGDMLGDVHGDTAIYAQSDLRNIYWHADHAATATDNTWHATQAVIKGAGSSLNIDGTTTTFASSADPFANTNPLNVGGDSGVGCSTDFFSGYITEQGVWPSDIGASIAPLDANQRAYWGFTSTASTFANNAAASNLPKFCVNIHNSTAPASNVTMLQNLGFTCVRGDIGNWSVVESSLGTYNFAAADGVTTPNAQANALSAAGIEIQYGAGYNNTLYSVANVFTAFTTGANINAYDTFVQRANTNFGSKVTSYELLNEVNLAIPGLWWQPASQPAANYATLLNQISTSLKAANPSVKVVASGLSPGPGIAVPTYAASLVAQGIRFDKVDYWGSHPYDYDTGTPANTLPPERMLVLTGRQTNKLAPQIKPIAVTEHGYPLQSLNDGDCTNAATRNMQGRYAARSMAVAVIAGYSEYAWYDLKDDGTPCASSSQYTFGLYDNSEVIKPSGTAVKNMLAAFAGTVTYSATSVGPYKYEITLNRAADRVKIIWDANLGASGNYSENMGSFSSATAKDVLGNTVTLNVVGSNVDFTLSEATGPVIVTLVN